MAKVSRKELLKRQDEFLTFTEKTAKWARRNKRRLIMGGAAALLLLVIALAGMAYYRNQQNNAALAYGQIFHTYKTAPEPGSPETLAMLAQHYSRMTEQYPKTPIGLQAGLCLANLYLQSGDTAKAEAVLTRLTQESGAHQDLLSLSWGTLGQCLEQAGKNDEAVQAYAKAAAGSGPYSADIWKTAQARLLLNQDKTAAQGIYEQVLHNSRSGYLRINAAKTLINMGVKVILPTTG